MPPWGFQAANNNPDNNMNTTSFATACMTCPLRKSGAFAANTPEEIAFIQQYKNVETRLAAGSLLIGEGSSSSGHLHTLLSGWAFRFRSLSDGKRQILNFLLPGDLIGLQEQLDANCQSGVELLTDAHVCSFPANGLWGLYQNFPRLAYGITWMSAHEELIVDENLVSVGQRTAAQRIAMLIIQLYKRAAALGLKAEDDSVPFPVTQQHIADALGLSLVHTNKNLRKLQQTGLYEVNKGRLIVHKPQTMARLADYYAQPLRHRPFL